MGQIAISRGFYAKFPSPRFATSIKVREKFSFVERKFGRHKSSDFLGLKYAIDFDGSRFYLISLILFSKMKSNF